MRTFDYSFLEFPNVPKEYEALLANISASNVKAGNSRELYLQNFGITKTIARLESIKCSNALEGITVEDGRIMELVKGAEPLNRAEQEIVGYGNALTLISDNCENMDLTNEDIKHLYSVMMEYTDMPIDEGYKTEEMNELIRAYNKAKNNSKIDPLLLIPCIVLDFLCINPFEYGSRRISRLISLLLLYKNEYYIGKYVSFAEVIDNYKVFYIKSFKKSSENWEEGCNDYFPFIDNFLTNVLLCYMELDKRLRSVNLKRFTKRERIELTILNSNMPMSKAEIGILNPDISPSTIETAIGDMIKKGQVKKVARGRNTKYISI